MSSLFDPLQIGDIHVSNRIWMAPLTRCRATRTHVPTPLIAEHYAQRADAGLIIVESTSVSQQGNGWPYAPGIFTTEQIEAWKQVTEAVHAKGGKIVIQLFHMGRTAHSSVTGMPIVSSSATKCPVPPYTYDGPKPAETAHALTIPEIRAVVQDFGQAAENSIAAGFDGVQLHAANGFLIEQFLKDSSNLRTDEYGGSVLNQTRFLMEVVEETCKRIGSRRVSLRFSPNGSSYGVHDSHGAELFTEVANALNKYDLSFVELRESGPQDSFSRTDEPQYHPIFNKLYKGVLVLNEEYRRKNAEEALETGIASAIAFGRPYMSNSDLVQLIRHKDDDWAPTPDESVWYLQGPEGYTDYKRRYD